MDRLTASCAFGYGWFMVLTPFALLCGSRLYYWFGLCGGLPPRYDLPLYPSTAAGFGVVSLPAVGSSVVHDSLWQVDVWLVVCALFCPPILFMLFLWLALLTVSQRPTTDLTTHDACILPALARRICLRVQHHYCINLTAPYGRPPCLVALVGLDRFGRFTMPFCAFVVILTFVGFGYAFAG
ncbi:hypothetical protein AVEN_107825-1 [Araneus ventricosus]|uniref:Uncharacterized protein n=1 Tax=Araneus ventricosus TaxID=182803 RepID=A0A4Y2SZD0_ARAVE|nr:hypothetical protein AVEN_107825-1 [Araneus ventricosus]